MSKDSTQVINDSESDRYEIYENGVAGFSAYDLSEGVITFTHTEIGPPFEGQLRRHVGKEHAGGRAREHGPQGRACMSLCRRVHEPPPGIRRSTLQVADTNLPRRAGVRERGKDRRAFVNSADGETCVEGVVSANELAEVVRSGMGYEELVQQAVSGRLEAEEAYELARSIATDPIPGDAGGGGGPGPGVRAARILLA